MIAKPSIAFNDFSGTAKEVTARNVNGRNVLSVRAKQSKVVSPSQAISRNQLSKVSRAYKQLSDSQMAAWAALAEHLKGISTFGLAAEMTAHNAFVRINENRVILGESMLADAPEFQSNIPMVTFDGVWVTPTRIIFTGISSPNSNYRLMIKMSKGQSAGVSNGWSKTVIIVPGGLDDWGEANVTTLYNEKIGFMPSLAEKVFIELWWVDRTNGFTGEVISLPSTCITDQEAEEEGLVTRQRITMADVQPTSSHVTDFDMDFSTGIDVLAVNAELTGSGSSTSSNIVLTKKLSYTNRDLFYMIGRANDGTHKNAQTYFGQFIDEGSNTRIMLGRSCGCYYRQTEVFGPAICYK